jgi:cytochrome d ubiquinol oxidase subunit II
MTLPDLWFWLIAILWTGYFVLEGFDFGVGILLRLMGRSPEDRDTMIETIGPVWDGNEVWLVGAAGATFAAFPIWYATMFSGFYALMLALLVVLILRMVSFEWRERVDGARAKNLLTWANTLGATAIPFLWGLVFANLLQGTPIAPNGDYVGSVGDLFSPYALFTGLALVVVFTFHGAVFLSLRTTGLLRGRALAYSWPLGIAALGFGGTFLIWTLVLANEQNDRAYFPGVLVAAIAAVALIAAVFWARRGLELRAFSATALAVAATIITVFVSLFPSVMVSDPAPANTLTAANASSSHYTLQVITIAIAFLLPLILLYQAWTYRVFRARIQGTDPGSPIDLVAKATGSNDA